MSRRTLRGFSLSEIVISILLLALVSITLLGIIPATQRATAESNNRATAARLADGELEKARAGSLGSLASGPLQSVTLNRVDYQLDLTVTNVTPAPAPQPMNNPHSNPVNFSPLEPASCRSVTVSVRWKDRQGQDKLMRATRVLFKL